MTSATRSATDVQTPTLAPYVLSVGVLLFLFSGFYKPYIPSPVDLTVAAALITCVGIILYRSSLAGVIRSPITLVYLAILVWTALRLFPAMSHWGMRKLAEAALFGIPAYLTGYVLANSPRALSLALRILSWASVPTLIYLVLTFRPGFNSLGADNYQLTGIFLSVALVSAASIGNLYLAAVAAVALIITGSLSGTIFGIIAAFCTWYASGRARRLLIYTIVVAAAFGMIALALAWFHIMPNRLMAKIDYALQFDAATIQEHVRTSTAAARPAHWETDRFGLFYIGWLRFLEHPWLGAGYGSENYLYDLYPHNLIIELAAETGIVGGILGLALFGFSAWLAIRSHKPFVIGYFVLVAGTALVSGYWGARLLLFGIGLVAGAVAPTTPPKARS